MVMVRGINKRYISIAGIITGIAAIGIIYYLAFPGQKIPDNIKEYRHNGVRIEVLDSKGKTLDEMRGFFSKPEKGEVVTLRHGLLGAAKLKIVDAEGKELKLKGVAADDPEGDLVKLVVSTPEKLPPSFSITSTPMGEGQLIYALPEPGGKIRPGMIQQLFNAPLLGNIYSIKANLADTNQGCPLLDEKGSLAGIYVEFIKSGNNNKLALPAYRVISLASDSVIPWDTFS
jgi:S1-C subfamily serine protease